MDFGKWGQKTIKRSGQIIKKTPWKKLSSTRWFYTIFVQKKVQIWDHFFPILFPKDSEYLTSLDIGLREDHLTEWRKFDGQTNTQNKQDMAKYFIKKTTKSVLLENSNAYPSWQKLRYNNHFFSSVLISFWIFRKSTFCFVLRGLFS